MLSSFKGLLFDSALFHRFLAPCLSFNLMVSTLRISGTIGVKKRMIPYNIYPWVILSFLFKAFVNSFFTYLGSRNSSCVQFYIRLLSVFFTIIGSADYSLSPSLSCDNIVNIVNSNQCIFLIFCFPTLSLKLLAEWENNLLFYLEQSAVQQVLE